MLRAFRIFQDLVTTQSFTEAAHRNYLTQSAVSHHLKALERTFGRQLVERGRGRIRLTRAGAMFFEASQELLKRYEQLETALKSPAGEVAGRLRIGSIYTVGLYELPHQTTLFLARYPKVDLLLAYLKDSEVQDALLADRIEIGIVDSPRPHPQLTITPFKKERVVLIVPPRHPWAKKKKKISILQLHDQPFIVPQAEFPVDEILRGTHVRVKVMHAFDNIEITKRAVEVGLGLALVPQITVVKEAQQGSLKILELTEGPFERTIGIITRKRTELSLPARKFIELLTDSHKAPASRG